MNSPLKSQYTSKQTKNFNTSLPIHWSVIHLFVDFFFIFLDEWSWKECNSVLMTETEERISFLNLKPLGARISNDLVKNEFELDLYIIQFKLSTFQW